MKLNTHHLLLLSAMLTGAPIPWITACSSADALPPVDDGDDGATDDTASTDETDDPTSLGDENTCGVQTTSESCDGCARTKCCEEQRDCIDDPDCVAWVECAKACDSLECALDCMDDTETARALATCLNVWCSHAC